MNDGARIGYSEFVAICHVDDPRDFSGFRLELDGLYVVPPRADDLITPKDRAVLSWHPTGDHSKPALSLPCTLGELRAFVGIGETGLGGCIDEDEVDAVLGKGVVPKSAAGSTPEAMLPTGIPTLIIIQKFRLTEAWADKLKHINRNPFLRAALMRRGCRKSVNTPATPHIWNPVVIAELLIKREGRNHRAMEAIITNHFADWRGVWHEFLTSIDADEYAE